MRVMILLWKRINSLHPFLLVGSNLASRTAVTIFAHAVFQLCFLSRVRFCRTLRICLCSLRCHDEAGHQLLSAQCSMHPDRKDVQSPGKNQACRADACFRPLATGVICQGASGGSWINEGLALLCA